MDAAVSSLMASESGTAGPDRDRRAEGTGRCPLSSVTERLTEQVRVEEGHGRLEHKIHGRGPTHQPRCHPLFETGEPGSAHEKRA